MNLALTIFSSSLCNKVSEAQLLGSVWRAFEWATDSSSQKEKPRCLLLQVTVTDLLKAEVIQVSFAYKYPSTMWAVVKLDFEFFYFYFLTKMDASRRALLLS